MFYSFETARTISISCVDKSGGYLWFKGYLTCKLKFNTKDQDQAIQVVKQTLKWCTRHLHQTIQAGAAQPKKGLARALSWVIGFIIGGDYSNELNYKISFQNLKNGEVIRLYVNMLFFKCFMTNKAPSGVKRHHEDIEPERCQMAKMFFSFFFFRLVQNCVNLSWQFSHKTAAFYCDQCTICHFFTTSKSHRRLKLPTQELGLHWDAISPFIPMCENSH